MSNSGMTVRMPFVMTPNTNVTMAPMPSASVRR